MNNSDISNEISKLNAAKKIIGDKIKKINTLLSRYSGVKACISSSCSVVKVAAGFSGTNFSLPVKIYGELLRPGKYYTGKISASELRKAYEKLSSGDGILLFTTHDAYWKNNTNINDVAGKLYQFEWDSVNNAIKFEGEVYDTDAAMKVIGGLVNGISAGFVYDTDDDGNNRDIEFKEATITFKPHAKNSFIKPVRL